MSVVSLGGMELDLDTIEQLAQRIHANYLARFAPDGPQWTDLTEDLREANRAQARAFVAKVEAVGAHIEQGKQVKLFEFTDDELDELARAEHQRWMDQRTSAGWSYDPVRDDAQKHHPMLVPWESLDEHEREKDRDAVRHIPDVLASVGLRVAR